MPDCKKALEALSTAKTFSESDGSADDVQRAIEIYSKLRDDFKASSLLVRRHATCYLGALYARQRENQPHQLTYKLLKECVDD